jgi:hypothetical protein
LLLTPLLLLLLVRLQVQGYFNKPQPPIQGLPAPIQFNRILNQAEYRAVLARLYKQLQVRHQPLSVTHTYTQQRTHSNALTIQQDHIVRTVGTHKLCSSKRNTCSVQGSAGQAVQAAAGGWCDH